MTPDAERGGVKAIIGVPDERGAPEPPRAPTSWRASVLRGLSLVPFVFAWRSFVVWLIPTRSWEWGREIFGAVFAAVFGSLAYGWLENRKLRKPKP